LAREYECARPSCERRRSASCSRPLRKRVACRRTPRSTSPTSSLHTHGMPVSSWITAPSLDSATPSCALASLPGLAFFTCSTVQG